jgi:hypothetical protein
MLDPVTAFGILASALQIAQQVNQLKNRVLAKSSDPKGLLDLRGEAHEHIARLKGWEDKVSKDTYIVFTELCDVLQEIVDEIDCLKNRNTVTKVFTSLRIYSLQFEHKIVKALRSFHLKVSLESQKQSEALWESMIEQMKQLHITKTQLEQISTSQNVASNYINDTIAAVESRMRNVEGKIEEIKRSQHQVHEILKALLDERIMNPARNANHAETSIGNIAANDSICRISAEILPASDSITWFGTEEADPKPPFRIWCLDDPESNKPTAELNGISISATPSTDTVDTIFTKRYAADDFDQNITRLKRRRKKDVTTYVGLVKKDGRLQTLRRFVPERLARLLIQSVPKDALPAILDVTRKLEQEYGYILFDRIVRNQIFSLPKLSELEELERGMMASYFDKLTATFHFELEIEGLQRPFREQHMVVKISRYH